MRSASPRLAGASPLWVLVGHSAWLHPLSRSDLQIGPGQEAIAQSYASFPELVASLMAVIKSVFFTIPTLKFIRRDIGNWGFVILQAMSNWPIHLLDGGTEALEYCDLPKAGAKWWDGGGSQVCSMDTFLHGIRERWEQIRAEERGKGEGRLTCFISCGVYSMVRMIITRSRRSRGMPWGEVMSSVPLWEPEWSHHPGLSDTRNWILEQWLRHSQWQNS